tara:strand:- start:2733 stop:3449 length:717 start_codon:yes stop_codon:yes gene_type:complete
MINDVRNTVLAILSKDNNGYITPEQFNLYAKNAQMEIFEQYMHDYSAAVNKRNARLYGSGLGDVPTRIAEAINRFNTNATLIYNGTTTHFELPTDAYSLEVISAGGVVVEPIAQNKLLKLNASLDTAPTTDYPVYTIHNNTSWDPVNQIKIYPTTIVTNQLIDYIRYPKAPKWTYLSVTDGSPLFNSQASDYQDFEIQQDEETNLVMKILQYSGIQISDPQVVQAAKSDEIQEKQEQK